ncbi:hypothetical protein JMJ56_30760 [Belnapia sp. T18]|uniref:Uncharacterized protein n=1 Tax=Belnapia arida TaxID=2804533 RepID=A0ABS1UCE2_9PROT|nr:hypothetical protein [Belnapia arida]MBL6082355.1 hypothetical protein [Belnapia arida]
MSVPSISTSGWIGNALGMLPDEASALLNRDLWKEGEVALLEAVAARLEVRVPEPARIQTGSTAARLALEAVGGGIIPFLHVIGAHACVRHGARGE